MAASKQADIHTLPQCCPASVGLVQARPTYQFHRHLSACTDAYT